LGLNEKDGFVRSSPVPSARSWSAHLVGRVTGCCLAGVGSHLGAAEEIARTVHAHPTLSEVLMEAAHAVEGQAIHI
jgi:dihydrolipoamide dehydrogenase